MRLDELMVGRTSFMIAHRLSTIRSADLILVMRNGRVVAEGTHDELLAGNNLYRKLFGVQLPKEPADAGGNGRRRRLERAAQTVVRTGSDAEQPASPQPRRRAAQSPRSGSTEAGSGAFARSPRPRADRARPHRLARSDGASRPQRGRLAAAAPPRSPGGATAPLASIAIVAFDGLVFTRLCLESLIANTDYSQIEVIVVDNGSRDGTGDYLRDLAEAFPEIRVLSNKGNLGFPHAVNQALSAAHGEVLVVLNNDTIVPPGWLAGLARHLADPAVGLVDP